MTPQLLQEIGLTIPQAKFYTALIENGELTPPVLAEMTNETRTNAYMVLEQLEALNLVEKVSTAKKLTYHATNPINLEKVSESRRKQLLDAESRVKQAMPTLLSYYYSFTERPGIKLFEGIDGLRELYQDTLRTKKPIHLLRTPAEVKNLGEDYINRYIKKRRELGIHTFALTPNVPGANKDPQLDEVNLFHRTWLAGGAYTAPVEIDIYGSKTAFMVFGEEVMGIVIDSPHVADAMRQLFELYSQNPSGGSEPVKHAPASK